MVVQTVFKNNSTLMGKERFSREMKEEGVSQGYLAECAREYLELLLAKRQLLGELPEAVLGDLVVVSNLAAAKSV